MIQPNQLDLELTTFLAKHKALKQYRNNVLEQSFHDDLPKEKSTWIDEAFTWDESPEGMRFWDTLDDKWRVHIGE